MARDAAWAVLLAVCSVCCSDGSNRCGTGTLPWRTEVEVALFDQEGRPVCNRGMLSARQFQSEWYPLWSSSGQAVLLPNGRYGLFSGPRCNVHYGVGTKADTPSACTSRPVQWRVMVEGCEPAEGSWSWEQNIVGGQYDPSFHIPIRLRCSHTVTPEGLARRDGAVTLSDASGE